MSGYDRNKIDILPEQEITKYDHYSKKQLDEFYDLILQASETKYHGYVFPDGRYANLFVPHYDVHLMIQQKYGFDPSITECLVFSGCVRVGYLEGQDYSDVYVETLYKPTKNAHDTILDYLYSQKNIKNVTISVSNNVLYGKYLKHILDKYLDCNIEIFA